MPTYEYRCTICGSAFEERRSITATGDAVRCPAGHAEVRRVFSVFAAARAGAAPAGGGGCCGGGCGCG